MMHRYIFRFMTYNFADIKWKNFVAEIKTLGREMEAKTGFADYLQLRKMERWGRCATFIGYATAWIFPNPISALFISQGIYTRWGTVFHQVSHGVFDRIPGVPDRYKSHSFAKGRRRFLDWFDWIVPEDWAIEHNLLHHYYLGSEKDPDVVWRNSEKIRALKAPLALKYFIAGVIACIWKPFYYAPNTLAEAKHHEGVLPTNRIGWDNWDPRTPQGWRLWSVNLLPYIGYRFFILPALFIPLGSWAVFSVFANSVMAEIFTNLHSFSTIGPNHTGDDISTFTGSSKNHAEFYLRQIVGTVNFPAGNDFVDFIYGGMNYQIEHHIWPEASLLQCQRARPKIKEICKRYGVRYHEASLWPRVVKTIGMIAGSCEVLQTEPRSKAV